VENAAHAKRRQLIVGNWKLNGSRQVNAELMAGILAGWQNESRIDVVVCPPDPYLQQVSLLIGGSPIILGAQNVSQYDAGAYTGEVSAGILADLDCKFVIIGHNERRRLQGETDEQVAQKFIAAQREKLIPILCIGESLAERENGRHLEVIGRQMQVVIKHVGLAAFVQAVVAYEPVWAVGTGRTATPEQAEEVHRFIRLQLGSIAQSVRILYGGSVKPHNAKELFLIADIDGALLGGASLVAEDFLKICEAAID
jgi:triosephosphate isomerase (TIM)